MKLRDIAAIVIVILGSYWRVRNAFTFDLWGDELWRANQIIGGANYLSLLLGDYWGPYEAPVQLGEYVLGSMGFLLWGRIDSAFRLWSVVFSIVGLVLFWLIIRRYCGIVASLFGLFLLAISPGLIEHSQEFKPYSFDVVMTLILFALVLRLKNSGFAEWRGLVAFSTLFALTSNCFPFVFHLLLYTAWSLRQNKVLATSRIILYILVVPFVVYLVLFTAFQRLLSEREIFSFWEVYYFTSWEQVKHLIQSSLPQMMYRYIFAGFEFHKASWVLSFVLWLVIAFVTPIIKWRKEPVLASTIICPVILEVILSCFGLFPMFQRVGTFHYPWLILSLSLCLDGVINFIKNEVASRTRLKLISLGNFHSGLLQAIFIGLGLIFLVYNYSPMSNCCVRRKENVSRVVRAVELASLPSETLYLTHNAHHAFRYYAKEPSSFLQVSETILPTREDRTEIVQSLLANKWAESFPEEQDKRVWFVIYARNSQELIKDYQKDALLMGWESQIIIDGRLAAVMSLTRKSLPRGCGL